MNNNKLKILIISSNPYHDINDSKEYKQIVSAKDNSGIKDRIELLYSPSSTVDDVIKSFNQEKPHIVHFIGHGNDQGEFEFHDKNGKYHASISTANLIKIFHTTDTKNLKLAFFNACYSSLFAKPLSGIIECTIGMRDTINDDAARDFAYTFYNSFFNNESIEKAFENAQIALTTNKPNEGDKPQIFFTNGVNKNFADIIDQSSSDDNINKRYTDDFNTIKKELKDNTLKAYDRFLNKIEKDYGNKNGLYFGLSIYKRYNDAYNILYSLSSYSNKTIHSQNTISENDFSGMMFNSITKDVDKITSSTKQHAYLKEFFDDIDMTEEDIESKLLYYTKTYEINNYYFIQFYLVFSDDYHYDGIKNATESFIEKDLIQDQKDVFKKIPNSNIKLMLKKGIKELENEIILLVDLVRSEKRMEEQYKHMDIVLTSKLIYQIKKIAGEFNFKTINHTGDGFIFVYRSEKDNINYDTRLFISKIQKTMERFYGYFANLNSVAQVYKVRGILGQCDKLFEIDYINSVDRKLYFSSDLDNLFKKLFNIEDCESNCLKKGYSLFFYILDYAKIGLSDKDVEKFILCNECEKKLDASILLIGVN